MARARDRSPDSFGWEKIELKPNPGSVLLPLSWGLLPLVLTVIVYFTETGLQFINFLGAGAVILMLVGWTLFVLIFWTQACHRFKVLKIDYAPLPRGGIKTIFSSSVPV